MEERVCTVEGCDSKKYYAKGMCRNCYQRYNLRGTTDYFVREVVACKIEDCERVAASRGMCNKHYARWWYWNRPGTGPVGRKRSTKPGYIAAHDRIRTDRGHAKDFKCVDCAGQATEWSLNKDAETVAGINNRGKLCLYSLNVDDYEPRCRDCHRAYDAEHKLYAPGAYRTNRKPYPKGVKRSRGGSK